MSATKRILQTVSLAAGVAGVVVAGARTAPIGSPGRKLARRLIRDARYFAASLPGIAYRITGRHPDPNVTDDILADRIRSSLGPVEKRLDLPHIHVIVEDHVAILHGEISEDDDARTIEHAIMRVSGVRGVESHLHIGLIRGDTRPSEGSFEAVPAEPLGASDGEPVR